MYLYATLATATLKASLTATATWAATAIHPMMTTGLHGTESFTQTLVLVRDTGNGNSKGKSDGNGNTSDNGNMGGNGNTPNDDSNHVGNE
jgi:hypothetical protein